VNRLDFNFEERFEFGLFEFLFEKNEGMPISQLINKPRPRVGSSSSLAVACAMSLELSNESGSL